MVSFELGKVVVTNGVYEKCKEDRLFRTFVRCSFDEYQHGIFGQLSKEDFEDNIKAIEENRTILAIYEYYDYRIWIITEGDRSVTTILFPDEY